MDENSTTEICPICLDPIQAEGEHQMYATPCGHVCGFCCLEKWVEINKNCPICRKYIEKEQTRKIVWNGKVPLDSAELDNLKELESTLRFQNRKLISQIENLQRDINIIQFESDKTSIYRPKGPTVIENRAVNRPSFIFEHQISSGYRVAVTSKQIMVTQQGENDKYGVTSFDTTDFKEDQFVPIHDQQIRELSPSPYDSSVIATVSNDSKLVQTSMRTKQGLINVTLGMPLWCCEWVRPNCVACGGTNGRFFVVDGRGDTPVQLTLEPGPPITSILRVDDDFCYVSTPRKCVLYDIRASGFTKTMTAGFNVGRSCIGCPKISGTITRKGNSATFLLQKFTQSRSLSAQSSFQIDDYTALAKPSACSIGYNAYFVVPNGKTFALFTVNTKEPKLGTDFWSKWKNRFIDRDQSQLFDVGIGHANDILVATVSEKKLCVYAIPQ